MPPRITDSQRKAVLALLAQGLARETVAAQVGVTPGQVSAVAAHLKMGTYEQQGAHTVVTQSTPPAGRERVHDLLEEIGVASRRGQTVSGLNRILISVDAETDEEVFWNPDPSNGAVNPHMLILGESGVGKTYALCCLLAELAQSKIRPLCLTTDRASQPRHHLVTLWNTPSRLKSRRVTKALRSIRYSYFLPTSMDQSTSRNGSQIHFNASMHRLAYNSTLSSVRRSST